MAAACELSGLLHDPDAVKLEWLWGSLPCRSCSRERSVWGSIWLHLAKRLQFTARRLDAPLRRDPSTLTNGKKKESAAEDPSSEQDNGKPKATRNILLIRHSQYNLSGNDDKERILTPLGREQAELTGQRLAALGLKYDVLIHSSMARATETANIISRHLPGVELVSCDLLREGAPIEPVPPVTHWKPDAVQYHEDGARIEAAFRRYIHRASPKQKEDSYEIIVCHANVIRYFVCRALQFPAEGWLRMGLNNGSITWLTIRPSGRVALRTLGDSGFMPPDKITRT
uniref:Serine/threonine-protein phosphatase PGAM5, mitochondrial n=1 Tax=Myripristis murdjan TaxID=586833 RepID=A0A668AD91_9TELE